VESNRRQRFSAFASLNVNAHAILHISADIVEGLKSKGLYGMDSGVNKILISPIRAIPDLDMSGFPAK
jgi:hypothetical protein